jgi:DHA1 family bicyclomycin/chloramphenicol resistance-like MFS transporter
MAIIPAAPGRDRKISKRELVVLMAMLMALQALAIDSMLPALPMIAQDLGVQEENRRQLVVGVFVIFSGIGCLFPGILADRFGRRPVALFALASYALMALGCSMAMDFTQLLVLRACQGLLASGIIVVPTAIIRDEYEGDRMARLMSLIFAVFITVPIVAPSVGQGILLFAGWRWIFVLLATMATINATWFFLRMPETLHPEYRQKIQLRPLVSHMVDAITRRAAVGYVFGASLVTSGIFGYVNQAQQLVGEHFRAGKAFPLLFGAMAGTMAVSSLTNARIVEKFGARRVSHAGLFVFIGLSLAQIWFAMGSWQSLAWFFPLMAANMAIIGFLTANFGSIAMQPFAATAGAASSIQAFVRMFGAGIGGVIIGQAYDGSSLPMAISLLVIGLLCLALVLYSERGRLFRRLNPPQKISD